MLNNGDIILSVKDLHVKFSLRGKVLNAIRGISLDLHKGESLAIVGESGSGKSVFTKNFIGLLDKNGWVDSGEILYYGMDPEHPVDLAKYKTEEQWQTIRGKEVAMVMQDPMTSLNPLKTIGWQIEEALKLHQGLKGEAASKKAVEILQDVGIPEAERRAKQYPHEFSGGMRQRVMIAIAIACSPKMVIADEPTTALDVTIQAQILELLENLKREMNTSVVMITHDLGVIASMCSRILVMYGGVICEEGSVRDIFYRARHPYTWGLLNSIPRIHHDSHEKLVPIRGTPPDMLKPPEGCPFAPRCQYCMPVCRRYMAPPTDLGDGHLVHCHLMHPKAPKVERGGLQHD